MAAATGHSDHTGSSGQAQPRPAARTAEVFVFLPVLKARLGLTAGSAAALRHGQVAAVFRAALVVIARKHAKDA